MNSPYLIPSPGNDKIAAAFSGQNARMFFVTLDEGTLNFKITRQALRDFEDEGLFAMDEYLITLSERLTPANEPEHCPTPLALLTRVLMNCMASANTQALMICILWLGHHYPDMTGIKKCNGDFEFSWSHGQA